MNRISGPDKYFFGSTGTILERAERVFEEVRGWGRGRRESEEWDARQRLGADDPKFDKVLRKIFDGQSVTFIL